MRGASLYDMARKLRDLGAVNAINLDGGGSSVAVANNSVVSFPSDGCTAERCYCPADVQSCASFCSDFTCVFSASRLFRVALAL